MPRIDSGNNGHGNVAQQSPHNCGVETGSLEELLLKLQQQMSGRGPRLSRQQMQMLKQLLEQINPALVGQLEQMMGSQQAGHCGTTHGMPQVGLNHGNPYGAHYCGAAPYQQLPQWASGPTFSAADFARPIASHGQGYPCMSMDQIFGIAVLPPNMSAAPIVPFGAANTTMMGANYGYGGMPNMSPHACTMGMGYGQMNPLMMAQSCAVLCGLAMMSEMQGMWDSMPFFCPHGSDGSDSSDGSQGSATGSGKMWDVWFDHGDSKSAKQLSPIVLDLNGNGTPDITGENILGDGKITGQTVDFDLDPTKRSWEKRSKRRRPGKGAPKLPAGTKANIYNAAGHLIKEGVTAKEAFKIKEGRAEFLNGDGLISEFKQGTAGKFKGQMQYHWGKQTNEEKTEWLKKGGGDGFLVWDVNGDGKIDSSKELFGNFDVDGAKRFANGYEKLAAHFDLDRNGQIDGLEMARAEAMGVKVWADQDGDGVTDAGELQTLEQHNIRRLSTHFNPDDMGSNYG